MSKNQEDNATSTSKEITETQCKKYEEFLGHLEKSQVDLEGKSVEEIRKLDILELAKYFCNIHLLIRNYQEYNQTDSDPSSSKEQKHDLDTYLEKHSKPNIDKFITAFDTLKTKVSQLQQCDQENFSIFNKLWTVIIMEHMNDLQDLTPENIENMTKEMQENFQGIIAGLKQLLDSSSLQESLKTWEMVIKSKDAVANLTRPSCLLGYAHKILQCHCELMYPHEIKHDKAPSL